MARLANRQGYLRYLVGNTSMVESSSCDQETLVKIQRNILLSLINAVN